VGDGEIRDFVRKVLVRRALGIPEMRVKIPCFKLRYGNSAKARREGVETRVYSTARPPERSLLKYPRPHLSYL
jgi:hypothetical protein